MANPITRKAAVTRNTIGHWPAIYETGGLEALLKVYVPAGKPGSLAPEVLASLDQALQEPAASNRSARSNMSSSGATSMGRWPQRQANTSFWISRI